MGVCVDKPVEWQDVLCQMQTESQVSSVSAFRLLNPLSASLFASVTLSRSPSPSLFFSCPLSSSLTLIIWLSTSSLLLHGKYFSPMSLSSCASSLLFPFASVHSLFFADAQRVTIPALRQAVNRESERKRFRDCERKRGRKKSTGDTEKVPAEALWRSPALQVQLLKLFQMCVQHFTSSANRSEPRSGRITTSPRPIFPFPSLCSSFCSDGL